MTTLVTAEQPNERSAEAAELRERQVRLLRLHHDLIRTGVLVRVRKPRNGRWKLTLRSREARWTETVLCAGAEGTYAYVTGHGRLLGSADNPRGVVQTLTWMIEGQHR
ncbi:hypothetical protein ACRYCC_27095 [Actinomadura scrupuli]|uniref:hypothetical protein n=1 Tax=Actinomadura scrupuli TaxID=559629 RepID=UPI003D963D0E